MLIQLEMELDGPLGPDEPGPIEHRRTQLDKRRIQGLQQMLEPDTPSFQGRHRLTLGEHLVEEGLVQPPRPMGIGVCERRASRCPPHAEVNQLAEGGGQVAADLAERVRVAHLTKQHRDEKLPVAEPLGCLLSGMLPDGAREVRAIDQGQDLRKATGYGYHRGTSGLWGGQGAGTPWTGVGEQPFLLTTNGRHFKNVFCCLSDKVRKVRDNPVHTEHFHPFDLGRRIRGIGKNKEISRMESRYERGCYCIDA